MCVYTIQDTYRTNNPDILTHNFCEHTQKLTDCEVYYISKDCAKHSGSYIDQRKTAPNNKTVAIYRPHDSKHKTTTVTGVV